MLNMIGGVGAGSVTAGLLSQAPETWNPALYQLAVNVHDVAVKPLTSVVFTVVLYVRFIELYALTAFQSLPFAFLVHEDTKPIGVGSLQVACAHVGERGVPAVRVVGLVASEGAEA